MSAASINKSSLVNIRSKSALVSQSLIYHKKDLIRANITLENGIHLLDQLPPDTHPSESIFDAISNCCKGKDTPSFDERIIPFKYILNVEPVSMSETDSEDDENNNVVEITYALPFSNLEKT